MIYLKWNISCIKIGWKWWCFLSFFIPSVPRVFPLLRLPGTRTLALNSSLSFFLRRKVVLPSTMVIIAVKYVFEAKIHLSQSWARLEFVWLYFLTCIYWVPDVKQRKYDLLFHKASSLEGKWMETLQNIIQKKNKTKQNKDLPPSPCFYCPLSASSSGFPWFLPPSPRPTPTLPHPHPMKMQLGLLERKYLSLW